MFLCGKRSQGDVMRQTEQAIRRAMDELRTSRPFVWEALELKKKLTMWQAQTTGLNILQAVGSSIQIYFIAGTGQKLLLPPDRVGRGRACACLFQRNFLCTHQAGLPLEKVREMKAAEAKLRYLQVGGTNCNNMRTKQRKQMASRTRLVLRHP